MTAGDPIARMFANLDAWRHLPSYQLERRADVFFSLYLHEVLEAELGVELEPTLIPEFPIKRDLVLAVDPSGLSVKVDYALVARDRSTVYFVELKTDDGSRNAGQDAYLEAARMLGFAAVLDGLREIMLRSKSPHKYTHLAGLLAELGFVRTGERVRTIEVLPTDARIEVVYIQPNASASQLRVIDFERFAAHVARHDHPLSQSFAAALLRWRSPAGRS